MRNAFPREFYIPKGSAKVQHKTLPAVVYITTNGIGRPSAIGFYGKANKPAFHYSFKSEERRAQYIAEWFTGLEASAKAKAERKQKRSDYRHDVKVGDVFKASWGYDQTNIDYFQVVALIGEKMAEVREICQQSEDTGWLQGDCVPALGQWATEADYSEAGKEYHAKHGHYPQKAKESRRVVIQGYDGGEPYFKFASYANAHRIKPVAEIAGAKVYKADHWTAYA